jgi:regulator of protease activity HflC (stomatin/prohibitin superfamily)
MKTKTKGWTIFFGIIIVIVLLTSGMIVETVDADKAVSIQNALTGNITWYTDPGPKLQLYGKVTTFKKSFLYSFSAKKDQGSEADQSIEVRFNDGGHGNISGTIQIFLPMDRKHLNRVLRIYGSQEAIEQSLIRPVLEKALYMVGPIMSSKESYAEKRNQLIAAIEDMITNGVYQTQAKEVRSVDPITGAEKTVTVVEFVKDPNAPNGLARVEKPILKEFGFRASNLNINQIAYNKVVEDQIKQQQENIMAVQTAIAEAKKAEQNAITIAKKGEAEATKAKWEQEVIKAKQVTEAQMRLEVAQKDLQTAELIKQKLIREGEGEGKKRELIMKADGALSQKLATYERVQARYAKEFGQQKWVPEVMFGGNGYGGGGGQVATMIDLLSMKALKDLGLDISVPGKK